MGKYNQKYWIEQYTNKKTIEQWFRNYLTYLDGHFHGLQNIEEIKQQFIKNELIEIRIVLNTERNQQKAYNFLKNVINKMEI